MNQTESLTNTAAFRLKGGRVKLPEPRDMSHVSLEEAIRRRRSVRAYKDGSVTLNEAAQLLWAAQGITGKDGLRAAPSAGATYPLETYLAVGDVAGLEPGLYHYEPETNSLSLVKQGELQSELSAASLDQPCVRDAAIIIILTAIYERTTERYGDRGRMYVHMDVGHAAENVLLQATALGLGGVPVGAFRTRTVAQLLGLPESEIPLYLLPLGRL